MTSSSEAIKRKLIVEMRILVRGGLKKQKTVNLGLLPKLGGRGGQGQVGGP